MTKKRVQKLWKVGRTVIKKPCKNHAYLGNHCHFEGMVYQMDPRVSELRLQKVTAT